MKSNPLKRTISSRTKRRISKAKMRCQNLINELKEKEKQLEKKQEVFQLYKNGLKGL